MSYSCISCPIENHKGMPLQFLCLHPSCLAKSKHVACLHCCQESHFHKNHIITVKELIAQMQQHPTNTDYHLKDILLKGLMTCQTPQQFSSNLRELIDYRNQPERYQKLIDPDMEHLQAKTAQHYQRTHQRATARTLSQKSSFISKQTITPVLSFKEGETYSLHTPFKVINNHNQLTTVYAQPPLSKFHDSISITLRIDRVTPNWLGIGLSLGQQPYQQNSSQHLLAISNGWTSLWGTLQPSKVRFGGGDEVKVKWDKELGLLILEARGQKETLTAESRWKDEVYLCVCLFYSGDSVSLLG